MPSGPACSDLTTVREALRAWTAQQRPGPKASGDTADIIDLMLATGARIGEILAVRWVDVALDATRPNLITREFYISKPAIAADVAHVLDESAEADPEGGPNTSGMGGQ